MIREWIQVLFEKLSAAADFETPALAAKPTIIPYLHCEHDAEGYG